MEWARLLVFLTSDIIEDVPAWHNRNSTIMWLLLSNISDRVFPQGSRVVSRRHMPTCWPAHGLPYRLTTIIVFHTFTPAPSPHRSVSNAGFSNKWDYSDVLTQPTDCLLKVYTWYVTLPLLGGQAQDERFHFDQRIHLCLKGLFDMNMCFWVSTSRHSDLFTSVLCWAKNVFSRSGLWGQLT